MQMKQFSKSILIFCTVSSIILFSYADRGIRSRSRNNIVLNINTNKNFRNALSQNLKFGLNDKGFSYVEKQNEKGIYVGSTIKTFQKGNTFYILPNKNKVIVPEIKQGYSGMKLVFKN